MSLRMDVGTYLTGEEEDGQDAEPSVYVVQMRFGRVVEVTSDDHHVAAQYRQDKTKCLEHGM